MPTRGPLIKRHLPLNDLPAFPGLCPRQFRPYVRISRCVRDSNSRYFKVSQEKISSLLHPPPPQLYLSALYFLFACDITRGARDGFQVCAYACVCVCEGDFGWRRDTRGEKKFYKIYKRERVTRSCRCIGLHTMSPSIRGISPPLPRNIFATRLPEFFPRFRARFIVRYTGKVSFYRLYNPRQEMRYS